MKNGLYLPQEFMGETQFAQPDAEFHFALNAEKWICCDAELTRPSRTETFSAGTAPMRGAPPRPAAAGRPRPRPDRAGGCPPALRLREEGPRLKVSRGCGFHPPHSN